MDKREKDMVMKQIQTEVAKCHQCKVLTKALSETNL